MEEGESQTACADRIDVVNLVFVLKEPPQDGKHLWGFVRVEGVNVDIWVKEADDRAR